MPMNSDPTPSGNNAPADGSRRDILVRIAGSALAGTAVAMASGAGRSTAEPGTIATRHGSCHAVPSGDIERSD